jgi:acyl-coenzyme A synthetase/AMP-(fatty) acid ligase
VWVRNVVTSDVLAAHYRGVGLWTADTLSSRVAEHVSSPLAGSIAVVDELGQRSHTYTQLGHDAAQLAAVLQGAGVAAGDVISVQLPNIYETVVAAVAASSIGAVINPLLPNYRAHELEHVFRTAAPRVIFTPDVYRGFDHRIMVEDVARTTGVRPFHIVVRLDDSHGGSAGDLELKAALDDRRSDSAPLLPGTDATAVSELIFTSGTEATPKAIMHTEETANFAVRATFADLGISAGHVVWMPSPVGHSTGFNYGIRAALFHGVPLVLQDRWDAADAVALVSSQQCNYTLAATTFLEDLVSECERTGVRLPSLTHFGCGGAPVPAALVARAQAAGICVLRLYGSTEVLCATWNRPSSAFEKRSTTDGFALRHTDIEVRDDDGNTLEVPAQGELHIRGPNTSVGFANDPERTAASYLADGWVRSGDVAQLDAEGYVTIVGRKKEIIIRGGVNIAPREIEDMLSEFAEIRQVAVLGIPDERLGERSCACLVLVPGAVLSFEAMIERLRAAGLATYKLPERMFVVDALPVTPSGKVQKHLLGRDIVEWSRS